MTDQPLREPNQIRQDAARKLRSVDISDRFKAILGCLLGEDWTTPRLVEMFITPDSYMVGRCEGEVEVRAFLGAADDLIRNIHGVAKVAGDEVGYPGSKKWLRLRGKGERSAVDSESDDYRHKSNLT